jgi:hypothetical protein
MLSTALFAKRTKQHQTANNDDRFHQDDVWNGTTLSMGHWPFFRTPPVAGSPTANATTRCYYDMVRYGGNSLQAQDSRRELGDRSPLANLTPMNATHAVWDFKAVLCRANTSAVMDDFVTDLGRVGHALLHTLQGRDIYDGSSAGKPTERIKDASFRGRVWPHNPYVLRTTRAVQTQPSCTATNKLHVVVGACTSASIKL